MRYFIAIFGDPNKPGHDTVASGVFSVLGDSRLRVGPGDYILLYCTADYPNYGRSAPGVGRVKSVSRVDRLVTHEICWFPKAVPLSEIRKCFTSEDEVTFNRLNLSTYRFREIEAASFQNVTAKWGCEPNHTS